PRREGPEAPALRRVVCESSRRRPPCAKSRAMARSRFQRGSRKGEIIACVRRSPREPRSGGSRMKPFGGDVMGERWPPGDPRAVAQAAFARQARAFSESPLQTDPRRLERLLTFLEPRPGERTLDLACGPGIVTRELWRAGLLATGLDLTREMLKEAVSEGG